MTLTSGEMRALEQVQEAGPLGWAIERHWESRTLITLASNGYLDMDRSCGKHSVFTLTDRGRALLHPEAEKT